MQCVSDASVSRGWGAGGISLSLVLLAAAEHSLLPRKDSGYPARRFLSKREKFGTVRTSAPKFNVQLRSSGDSTEL